MQSQVTRAVPTLPAYTYRASTVGGADDSANIAGILARGVTSIHLVDGVYQFRTPLFWPVEQPGRLIGSPNTHIICTGASGGLNFDGFTPAVLANAGNVLSVDAAIGATSVTLTATTGLVVGSPIVFVAQAPDNRAVQSAYVLGLPGAGVVQLGTFEGQPIDLVYAFKAGTQVLLSPGFPRGVRIEGNGMTVTADGSMWCFESQCGHGLVIQDMTWMVNTAGLSQWGGFFDIGSRGCVARRIRAQYVGGAPIAGIGLAYAVDTDIEECFVTGPFTGSIQAAGARRFKISDTLLEHGAAGLILNSEYGPPGVNDTLGCRWGTVSNVTVLNMSGAGFLVDDGGQDIAFHNCTSLGAPVGFGIEATLTSSYADHVSVYGGKFQGSNAGIQVLGGVDLHVRDVDVSGSDTGVSVGGAVRGLLLDGVTADDCTTSAYSYQSAGISGVEMRRCTGKRALTAGVVVACADIILRSVDLTDSGSVGGVQITVFTTAPIILMEDVVLGFSANLSTNIYGFVEANGGDITMDRVRMAIPTGPAHFSVMVGSASGTYRMRDVRVVPSGFVGAGGGGSIGILASGGTLLDMGGCDFSLTGTPYSFAGGTKTNWGSWVANGASDVVISNVASPGTQATVTHYMVTPGGTIGAPTQSTALSAGSFSLRSQAGDTSSRVWVLR